MNIQWALFRLTYTAHTALCRAGTGINAQSVGGGRLLLLTPRTVENYLGPEILDRGWTFESLAFTLADGIETIIAKSDFIRMAFVHRYGGIWVDAGTWFLRDPTEAIFPMGERLVALVQ